MQFAYRTREMDDPRGRPKVFFSCHPADFAEAFELVVEDVLTQANCVIWYDAGLTEGDEEFRGSADTEAERKALKEYFEVLDGMQLLVFAVTSRFLEEPSRARDVELPHALEQHIPILPIMLENGLESDFNEKCAPIQVVNRYVGDPTATPYKKVLRTFLASVLVGDELAALVRDAFDAYVFLSYRKKDRRHAQRLMHLIHENERFRDIAIWYDEYLVPGESFDAAIEAAFLKSSLFALAVTPQLLEEGNYVKEVEYPMARKRKEEEHDLEIVPVEMYDLEYDDPRTNLEDLASDYEEIPPVQDEHSTPELNTALVEALDRIGKKDDDGSAQHRFFIGLAYLNGIDVQPNYQRALGLLKDAANDEETPCVDAAEKLVDMYLVGEGVKRNVDEAICWQRRVVHLHTAAYREHRDPDEHRGFGTKRFKALIKLSDLLSEAEDTDGALMAAGEAYEFLRELAIEVGLREMERDKAVLLNRLGDLNRKLGDLDHAMSCYWEARGIYGKLASVMGTVRARRDFSISLERLGDICREQGSLSDAENHYWKACEIRKALAEADLEPRNWRDLSSIYTKLGDVRKDEDDLRGAANFYGQALEMDCRLAEELRTSQATDDLAVSLIKMGDVAKKRGDFAEAIERYGAAEALYSDLADSPGSRRYCRNHALSLGKLASACKHVGDRERAARCYEKADDELLELFSSSTGGSDAEAHGLAVAYYNHAQFAHDKELAQKAREIWEGLSVSDKRYERYLGKAERLLEKL